MTTAQLKNKLVRIRIVGYGMYEYTFIYRNKEVKIFDADSTKYDAIKTGEKTAGTTQHQALTTLWNKINNINHVWQGIAKSIPIEYEGKKCGK